MYVQCGEPNNVGDLEKQPFYRFLRSTYLVHPFALGALLYAAGGFPFLVWGMVQKVSLSHFTFTLKDVCSLNKTHIRTNKIEDQFGRLFELHLSLAGSEDCLGLSHNLVCELSLPCMGESGLEHQGLVQK